MSYARVTVRLDKKLYGKLEGDNISERIRNILREHYDEGD
jgi:hypothetical protein